MRVSLTGGRCVCGTLRGWDALANLVLDDAVEQGDMDGGGGGGGDVFASSRYGAAALASDEHRGEDSERGERTAPTTEEQGAGAGEEEGAAAAAATALLRGEDELDVARLGELVVARAAHGKVWRRKLGHHVVIRGTSVATVSPETS